MKKLAFTFLVSLFIFGCGYIPATNAVDAVMDDNIWFEVNVDMIDPENSVTLKDATINGFVDRLGKKIAPSKELANSIVETKIKSINFSALIYDRFGYVTTYKVNLTLSFKTRLKSGEIFERTTSGDYDFEVSKQVKNVKDISSVISDKDRYEAIKNASYEALNEFISQLSLKGLMTINKENNVKKLQIKEEVNQDEQPYNHLLDRSFSLDFRQDSFLDSNYD